MQILSTVLFALLSFSLVVSALPTTDGNAPAPRALKQVTRKEIVARRELKEARKKLARRTLGKNPWGQNPWNGPSHKPFPKCPVGHPGHGHFGFAVYAGFDLFEYGDVFNKPELTVGGCVASIEADADANGAFYTSLYGGCYVKHIGVDGFGHLTTTSAAAASGALLIKGKCSDFADFLSFYGHFDANRVCCDSS